MSSRPDRPSSLLDIALRRARHDPDTPLLLTADEAAADGFRRHSYGEILDRAVALADVLGAAGVGIGDIVGCYLANEPSWVVASFAAWMRGAGVAAAGTLLPQSEAANLFGTAGVDVVVTTAAVGELAASFEPVHIDSNGFVADQRASWTEAGIEAPEPEQLAVAIFTSGTTGKPKGITHTHFDLIAASERVAAAYAKSGDYRPTPAPADLPPGTLFNPFGHMAGFSRLSFRMWIGRPTVLIPKFSVEATRRLAAAFRLDTLQLSPAMIHMLATADDAPDLSSVKYVTSGTAPLSMATREAFEERFGVPVMQAYGMTETGGVAQERYDDVVAGRRGPGSVGRIAKGVEVKFRRLDDDRPEGEGEILVRTDEATEHFLGGAPVPVDEDGWFATGDVGRLDDGILYITGRVEEKIIVGGFNVYPAEVEEVASQSSLVSQAVVVSLPDDRLGEIPVAGIVWESERDPQALLAELREKLAGYKVPRQVFDLVEVPLTPRDKVDRRRATELAREALSAMAQGS